MSRCDACKKTVTLPFHCQYCGKNFCDEHRLPPNHACAGLLEWKKTPAPGVGIRYGAGGAAPFGGGYAAVPKKKKEKSFWQKVRPYIPVIIVGLVLIVLVVVVVLTSGCIEPGENSTAANGTSAGGSSDAVATAALPATSPAPAPPITTLATTATSPPATPAAATQTTQARSRPTLPARVSTTAASAETAGDEEAYVTAAATTAVPSITVSPAQIADDPYTISPTSIASRIHELINAQRQANGLSSLSFDSALASIALGHSADMAENNYFSHTDLSGNDATARGTAAGYTCRKDYGTYYTIGIGENLFQNNLYASATCTDRVCTYAWTSPEEIAQSTVSGWMNSAGHRKNILTSGYDREGIGISISSDNKVYITENFC